MTINFTYFTNEQISEAAYTIRGGLDGAPSNSVLAEVFNLAAGALETEYMLGGGRGWATFRLDLADRKNSELLGTVQSLHRLAKRLPEGDCLRVVYLQIALDLLEMTGQRMATVRELNAALSL